MTSTFPLHLFVNQFLPFKFTMGKTNGLLKDVSLIKEVTFHNLSWRVYKVSVTNLDTNPENLDIYIF